jgi:ArsR family transcriptional regulator, arsenate/arsenite/antimonite-responsive transcriptional repressor
MRRNQVIAFKALGDPNRIRIMKMLEERELCVCEVREVLDLSNSTVSKHLSILRDADLIVDSKDGKWVNYQLNGRSDKKFVRSLLASLHDSFKDDEDVRTDRKKVQHVDRNKICGI